MSLRNLLASYLLFWPVLCLVPVGQLPKPRITRLDATGAKRALLVSWLVNHSSVMGDTYELQISRANNHTIVYDRNISVLNLGQHSWTWTSDLPLECADHSVRIRRLYNRSVPSPWSNWETNSGAEPTDKTMMFPVQLILREGDSPVFCCVPPRGDRITAMTLNDEKHPLLDVGAAVTAISVKNLTIPTKLIKSIRLGCIKENGQSWKHLCCMRAAVPSQKPRNLSCVTTDLTTVTCSWASGRKRDPKDRNNQTNTLHIQNSGLSPVACQQSSCTFQALPRLEEYNISVVVKDQLGEETANYCFNIRDRVVPVAKWCGVVLGVTTTNLSLIIQGNLTLDTLLCQVTTDPGSSSEVSSATSGPAELSCDRFSRICEVKLKHLSPGSQYAVRGRCSITGGLWGPWTKSLSFKTYPLVTLDVWRRIKQLSDPHSRQITLLWVPHVSSSAPHSLIRGYWVEWSQDGKHWSRWRTDKETRAEFSIGPGRCDITAAAVLHMGSNISAHITIPPDGGGESPPALKRLHGTASAAFNLSWEKQETATCGYTVEWCSREPRGPCALQWVKVPAGSNTLSLPAENFKSGCRFTFNIYGCSANGHELLEIQTGYTKELQSVAAPSLVNFTSESSSVTLEWRYDEDDRDHPAFITGYLVTVQEAQQDTLADLLSVSVSDPRRKAITIDGLQHNREYVFSLSALTRQGPGQATSISIRTKPDYSAHLVQILAPILLLLVCAALLWPRRKVVKTALVSIFVYPAGMDIRAPDVDSFPQEMAKKLQSRVVEECKESYIEILSTGPRLDDAAETDALTSLAFRASPSEASLAHIPIQVDYRPQLPLRSPPAGMCHQA
uniref:Fibronectin type-III domain-containing protein n=1 Tax=Takifugu rubripes TaxID=31033 RepID=A0A3B5KAB1_TAKRU